MITNTENPPELNMTRGSLSITRITLKWCLNNKLMNRILPTSATMSMKPIQSPSAPIKPREDLNHHWVVTWTLKWTRWIQTTDKLITTELWYSWNLQIYQLPSICSLWIYSDIYISCQKFVILGYIVIRISVAKNKSLWIYSDKGVKK